MNPFEFPDEVLRYADEHTSDEDEVLYQLYRQTYLKAPHPQMLSGKVQGRFLTMLSQMIRPKRILEIGTFTGYSAYCLSKGLQPGGKMVTIEVNPELEEMISGFIEKAGMTREIELIIGDALDVIPKLDGMFDLVFIDANKDRYPDYLEICLPKLNTGAYLFADNVLWGGKVAQDPLPDTTSVKVHKFNEMIHQHPELEHVFLTIRDGLIIARKK